MVLRSGIIIPFQFRDTKKLLMIGGPEENRNLSIWDLRNVVRAAFGIYNFEFRNKKIGFNIPDELLLHYLAQRHDLTNFVIEIGQGNDDAPVKDALSFEPSCSLAMQKHHGPQSQKSNESGENEFVPTTVMAREDDKSPMEHRNNSPDHSSNPETVQKPRIAQGYTDHSAESLQQSIDPMAIIPKSEEQEAELTERTARYGPREHMIPHQLQHQSHQSHFFPNYAHNILGGGAVNAAHLAGSAPHQSTYTPALMNRFRRRGERMSKDQKELYVKYFEENSCMLSQRRNDTLLEPHWTKLANMLNAVPQGAVKNVEEWKQTFDAWRYRVFMYTRYNSKLTGAAAQNPKNYKPLTPTDQRAYAMWTSHKHTTPHDYEKMDMFAQLDETTHNDYDY